jgi:hypothetical protein
MKSASRQFLFAIPVLMLATAAAEAKPVARMQRLVNTARSLFAPPARTVHLSAQASTGAKLATYRTVGDNGVPIAWQNTPNNVGQWHTPAGYQPVGPRPINGGTMMDLIRAKADVGYPGGLHDFAAGRGIVRRR